MPGSLQVTELPSGVRVLTLSNPARRNAIDAAMLGQLDAAISNADGVRAFIVRGAGDGVFSAGWDLNDLSTVRDGEPLPDDVLGAVFERLAKHAAPSVAVLDGPAFGAACELAIACDFRVGSSRTVVSMPPARLGVVYGLGGLGRFREKLGDATTRYLFLTGRRLDAAECLRRGLIDVQSETPHDDAQALARELAGHAPLAIAGLKRGLSLLAGSSAEERAAFETLRRASFNSADAAEGRAAILEKRSPRFRGA